MNDQGEEPTQYLTRRLFQSLVTFTSKRRKRPIRNFLLSTTRSNLSLLGIVAASLV